MGERLFTAGVAQGRTRRRRPVLIVLAALVAVLVGVSVWLAVDLRDFAERYEGRILPGVTVAGLDLAGVDRAEALARVDALHQPLRERRLTLRLEDADWSATLGELGFRTDAARQVDAALAVTRGQSAWELFQLRWDRLRLAVDLPVATEVPDAPQQRLVRRVAAEARREAVDAQLDWDRNRPAIAPEQVGREVDVDATLARLTAAVVDPHARMVEVVAHEVAPEVTRDAFGQILFLRQHDHLLDLYLEGRHVRSFPVAVGTGDYPTPTGRYEVSLKRHRPTWVNPSPTGWGRGLPARIGPGANNPLGLRALNWSAPGAIRFHGTADVGSIGRDASHGCVRLSNPDVIELYDLVDEGAVIISTS